MMTVTDVPRILVMLIIWLITNCGITIGQVYPDSLQRTLVSQLSSNDTLVVYVSYRGCFGGGFEKFWLTSSGGEYELTAFETVGLADVMPTIDTLKYPILPDTLRFVKLNTYHLTDSNMLAWAAFENLGVNCGIRPRGPGGAIGIYRMKLNQEVIEFSNKCRPMGDYRQLAIPEQYEEDLMELDY